MNIETVFDFLIIVGLITLAGLGVIYLYTRAEMKKQKDSLVMVTIRHRNIALKKLNR